MLKKAAWLALKIEAVLYLILVLMAFVVKPAAHTESMVFIIVPALTQLPALWLLPKNIPNLVAAPLVFLVQYLLYTAIVFIILLWRANSSRAESSQ
jgi:hypothetical protein